MLLPNKWASVTSNKCRSRLNLDLRTDNGDFLNCGNVRALGGLRSTRSFEQVDFPVKALKVIAEHKDRLYVLGEDGLYSCKGGEATRIISKSYYAASSCIYQDTLIFSGPRYGTYLVKGDSASIQANVGSISLAICCDRQFGLELDNYLNVTPIGATEWYDYFTITPQTKFGALVTIGRKLYALGDTCYVFEPHSVEDVDITYRAISQGTGVAQTDTQATFGRKAVFATDCGLRLLKPDSVTPIFDQLNDYVSFVGSVACSHGGLYYVSCKRKDGLQERNDVTLILDVHSEKVVGIFDMGLENLYSTGENLYATKDGTVLKLGDGVADSCWLTTVDFGNAYRKFLDALVVNSKRDVEIEIAGDNGKRTYYVKGKNCTQRLPVNVSGRSFAIKFQCQEGLQVDYAELTARRYEV